MDSPVHDFNPPMYVDHVHERLHQHNSFLGVIGRRAPNQKGYPNYPDVDISDGLNHFYIDVEVPGLSDPKALLLERTGFNSLILSGTATRPRSYLENEKVGVHDSGSSEFELKMGNAQSHENGGRKTDNKSDADLPPWLVVAERKIGFFRREFQFPVQVEMDKVVAKLKAGLLSIDVPKKTSRAQASTGVVKIVAVDMV